jgi:hypothetical protein
VDFFQKKFDLVASISRGLRAVIDIIWISSSSNGNSSKENKI